MSKTFNTIVWATDGSEAADLALPYAKGLATSNGGKLVVVHAVERLMGPRAGGYPVHADEEELEAKIKRQVEGLVEEGVNATLKFVEGNTLEGAPHMIAEAASEVGADAIVTGTRGHNPITGLLVGSVTQRLLHIAACPVVAVPAR